MNNELQKFIEQARAKNLSDEQITSLLKDQGWNDNQIVAGLNGLAVPTANTTPTSESTEPQLSPVAAVKTDERPSISHLEAALQHVLLWVFTLTSTIMFGVVAGALTSILSGYGDGGTGFNSLFKIFLVVEIVAFVPFLIFYIRYLKRQAAQPGLLTGKVWSIITIVLHSVGFIGALISLIVTMILSVGFLPSITLFNVATVLLNGFVVITYTVANFSKLSLKFRRQLLWLLPVGSALLIAAFAVVMLVVRSTLGQDSATRETLVSAVEKVHEYTTDNNALPDSLSQAGFNDKAISYNKTSDSQYQICADFDRSSSGRSYSSRSGNSDSYVSTYDFTNSGSGRQCFKFYNTDLQSARGLERYDDQTIIN